ncbi:ATP-binding protein [Phenylobacterium sp.]|uniref:ATP-binding protein n=1 Tax=Phenylobacterium sp. TaxID=1871053 RepID=UPI0035AED0DA
MQRIWKSFRARLIIGSVVWICVGVAVSGVALSELFRAHVTEQFDGELHGHAAELAALVDLDAKGRPYLHRRLSDPRFLPKGSGFYWQIDASDGQTAASPSLAGATLPLDGPAPAPGVERHSFIDGPTGQVRLVQRAVRLAHSDETLRIGIGADERLLQAVLADFNRTLALSLGVIALGLIAAAFLQVWFGLQPLAKVRASLADVRQGRIDRLPSDAPDEVMPLVDDLNALIDANHEMIRRARAQAGNLAHGLKTPLAILVDEGERLRAAGDAPAADVILAQCDRMRRQIDYQIARARAAASRSAPGAAADVVANLDSVMAAMRRLHGRRGVSFGHAAERPLVAAVEAQDLSEMVANLVDNAGKWAASRVEVAAYAPAKDLVRITVDDDGPGLPPEAWDVVFNVGQRLDEQAPGSGLGLSIVRDLAVLYGGRVWLEQAPLGGLRAVLELPRA